MGLAGSGVGVLSAIALDKYLPLSYQEKIDYFKTSILTNEGFLQAFEEESPFFEEYSSHEVVVELRKHFFNLLVTHIFRRERSVEFYVAFFHTYGYVT